MTVGLRASDLVPPAVLHRVADRQTFLDDVARYVALSDDDLLRATEVCLRNLDRIDDLVAGPDNDLQLVLVPELWERIRPGTTRDRQHYPQCAAPRRIRCLRIGGSALEFDAPREF